MVLICFFRPLSTLMLALVLSSTVGLAHMKASSFQGVACTRPQAFGNVLTWLQEGLVARFFFFFLKGCREAALLVTRKSQPPCSSSSRSSSCNSSSSNQKPVAAFGMTSRPFDRQWTVVCTWRMSCSLNGWLSLEKGKGSFLGLIASDFNEFRKTPEQKEPFSCPQAAEFGQFFHVSLNFTQS